MTGNGSSSSDVGFIVLIFFALLALIPLAIGVNSFDELFRVGKIIIIVVIVAAVIAGVIFGYLFFKGKIRKRNTKKERKSDENQNTKRQRYITELSEKANPTENES
jgi:hypothetical protein